MLVSLCNLIKFLTGHGANLLQFFLQQTGRITSHSLSTSQILLKLMKLRTLPHMQLFKFLNSNSVDMGFRTLLFQTQFSSQEFHEFTLIWAFNDVTSSAHYAKANSKAESSVKTVKQLFKKAKRDGEGPWFALLDYRNTLTEGLGTGPAQREHEHELCYLQQ